MYRPVVYTCTCHTQHSKPSLDAYLAKGGRGGGGGGGETAYGFQKHSVSVKELTF